MWKTFLCLGVFITNDYVFYSAHEIHFRTKGLWAHNPNLVEIQVAVMVKIVMKLRCDFAYATVAEQSRHVQNFDLIGSLECTLEQIYDF